MSDEQRLLDLNRLTFDAESRPPDLIEGQPWDEFLSSVLTDDFYRAARPGDAPSPGPGRLRSVRSGSQRRLSDHRR
jgi:hypothetical protein